MKKRLLTLAKKSFALAMTVLMILSCWIFAPVHEHLEAHAAAQTLNYTLEQLYQTYLTDNTINNAGATFVTPQFNSKAVNSGNYANLLASPNYTETNAYNGTLKTDRIEILPFVDGCTSDKKATSLQATWHFAGGSILFYDGSTTKAKVPVIVQADPNGGDQGISLVGSWIDGTDFKMAGDHWNGLSGSNGTVANYNDLIGATDAGISFGSDTSTKYQYSRDEDNIQSAGSFTFEGNPGTTDHYKTYNLKFKFYVSNNNKTLTSNSSASIVVVNYVPLKTALNEAKGYVEEAVKNNSSYTPESIENLRVIANQLLAAKPDDTYKNGNTWNYSAYSNDAKAAITAFTNWKNAGGLIRQYTITWNVDGATPITTTVAKGLEPTYPNGTPTKASTVEYDYTFSGWSPAITAATEDTAYTAQFTATKRKYTITFVDYDDSFISSAEYEHGTTNVSAAAPADPVREGYVFNGWGYDLKNFTVEGDHTFKASYSVLKYKVTFEYYNGTTDTVEVEKGQSVDVSKRKDEKPADENYHYVFTGWSSGYQNVTGDVTVHSEFKSVEHSIYYVESNPATCTSNAYIRKICSVCGYNFDGQEFLYNPDEDPNAADNTHLLQKEHEYNDNDISYSDDDYHYIYCGICGGATKAVQHNWSEGGKPTGATCTKPGTVIKYCLDCSHEREFEGEIDPDAHKFNTKEGTPNNDGATHTVKCIYSPDDPAHTESVACTDKNEDCVCDICRQTLNHVYDQKTTDHPATSADCVNDATYYLTCKCGAVSTETWTDEGSRLGHKWEDKGTDLYSPADCENDALYYQTCATCGISARNDTTHTGSTWADVGSRLGHNYTGAITSNDDGETHTVACINNPEHKLKVNCTDEDNNCKCDVCGQNLGHVYSQKVESEYYLNTPADCVNDATYFYACKCGDKGTDTWTKEGSRLGHDWKNEGNYLFKEADCENNAVYYQTCATCGISAEYDTTYTGSTWIKENTKLGHKYTKDTVNSNNNGGHNFLCANGCGTYGYNGIKNAFEPCDYKYENTATGTHEAECTVCQYSFSESCSGGTATCTEQATCEKCDTKYGETAPHFYKGTVVPLEGDKHAYRCKYCNDASHYGVDEEVNATEPCSGGTATCKDLAVCDKCSETYGGYAAHKFDGEVVALAGDVHAYRCSVCKKNDIHGVDAVENATEPCSGGTATCKDLAVCDKCEDTHGGYAAHVFNGEAVKLDGDVHAYRCSVCKKNDIHGVGAVENATEPCSGGSATCKDLAVCHKCNDTHGGYAAHVFGGEAVKLAGDVHAYRCSVCKKNDIHGVGAVENATEPCSGGSATCTDLAVCDICKDTHGELNPEAHNWGAWENVAGTETHKRVCLYNNEHTETEACVAASQTVFAPDCEAEGYTLNVCGVCNHEWKTEIVAPLTHAWSAWVNNGNGTHTRTCEREGCEYENGSAKTETVACTKENATYVVTDPTCLEKGFTTYTCNDCGYVWDDDYTDATGHSFKEKRTGEVYKRSGSDCSTDLTYWYCCENDLCDVSAETIKGNEGVNEEDLYWVRLASTGHSFVKVATEDYLVSEATCTDKAVYYTSCEYCYEKGTETFTYGRALGHNWVEPAEEDLAAYLATPSDCITDATYHYVCDREDCGISSAAEGKTWTDEGSKSGHDFTAEDAYTEAVAATCTTAGNVEYYTCSICDKHFKADKKTEIAAHKLVISATGHDWEDVAKKAATCEEAGYTKHKQCKTCNVKNDAYDEIAPLGHNFKAENGYFCDEENNVHAYKCSACDAYGIGTVKNATEACVFDGEYTKFTDENGVHFHKKTCVCGNVQSAACTDTTPEYVAPTCDADGYYIYICEACGYEWIVAGEEEADKALGHDFTGATWTKIPGQDKHIRECIRNCGETETEACYTADYSTSCGEKNTCDVCNAEFGVQISHDWKEIKADEYIYTPAACNVNAVYYKVCANCGSHNDANQTWVDEGSALKHEMHKFADEDSLRVKKSGSWVYDNNYGFTVDGWNYKPDNFSVNIIKPTCGADGLAISYCINCSYYETKVASKNEDGHNWVETEVGEGNCATGITIKSTCTVCSKSVTTVKEAVEHDYKLITYIPATCEDARFEYYVCTVCGDDEEKHIGVALGHSWDTEVIEKEATCGHTGRKYFVCSVCNVASEKIEIPKEPHVWDAEGFTPDMLDPEDGIYVEASAATCLSEGYNSYYKCYKCSYDQHLDEEWRKTNVTPKLDHKDADADGRCDECNTKLYVEDDDNACDCICHKDNWFSKIIYKILLFFWKLFGIGKSCDCGTVHY